MMSALLFRQAAVRIQGAGRTFAAREAVVEASGKVGESDMRGTGGSNGEAGESDMRGTSGRNGEAGESDMRGTSGRNGEVGESDKSGTSGRVGGAGERDKGDCIGATSTTGHRVIWRWDGVSVCAERVGEDAKVNCTGENSDAHQISEGTEVRHTGEESVSYPIGKNAEVYRISVANTSGGDIQLSQVCLEWAAVSFEPRLDARDYVQLYHSRDFMKLSGVRPLHRPNAWSNPADASAMVTVLSHRGTQAACLLGALPPYGDCFVDLPVLHEQPHRDGAFGIGFHLQVPRRLAQGETLVLAQLVIMQGASGTELLAAYADRLRASLAPSFQPKPRATGWNSWDYYAGAVSEQDVAANARLSQERYGDSLRYIVIDEGYERQWGVWEAGWKFPAGLEALCADIRQAGCEPGIWTAPLMVNVYTPLYRERPDWFVGDAQGNPYLQNMGYGSMAQLDITHPDVPAYIEEQFRRLRTAGFTYFKCDFTQMLQGASTFARKDMTHAGMIRELFQIIRSAIGDEAYLLACGAPYEAVIGIVDAHRTTGDIHHYWSQIQQNIRSMFARYWMQGTIGNTDPDFAIVRCEATTDDRQLSRRLSQTPWKVGANWTSGREMELEEAKALLLACYMTGGDLLLGDALPKLNELGLDLLAQVLERPAGLGPGVPINLFDYDGDETPILLARGGERSLLAVFNLTDDYRQVVIPPTYRAGWSDFWQVTGALEGTPAVERLSLAPRSARAFWITQGGDR